MSSPTWLAPNDAPSRPPRALVPLAPRPLPRWERLLAHLADAGARARTWRVLLPATFVSFAGVLFGVPTISIGVACFGAAHFVGSLALQTRDAAREERARWPFALALEPEVEPFEILSPQLREAYLTILRAHEDLRRSLAEATRMQPFLRTAFLRCAAMVHASGRLARLANPVVEYLHDHDPTRIQAELSRLAGRAERAEDPQAVRAFGHATAARARQLETHRQLTSLRDRIDARLEMVHATFEAITALVIELQVRDLEEVELATASVSEDLASLREELDVLETTMTETWAVAPTS